jgi:macrodomain Ter protein organizer (MatP/YcbG family)
MATATARKVDDRDYAALSETADENGRSISEELRNLIAEHARKRRAAQTVADLKALRDKSNWTLPNGMTSLDLLREERDSW